jgi:hypothetical protein
MDPRSTSKFDIKGNRKTRSNGLPTIDHSMSPLGLCVLVADAAKTGEWKAGKGSTGMVYQGG